MKMPSGETPEQLALHQVHAVCLGHVEALQDALKDMAQRALTPAEYEHLTATDRRLLDQFAHDYPDNPVQRFERLQVAIEAAGQLLTLMSHISHKLSQRFP